MKHVVPHLDRVGGYERQAVLLATQQLTDDLELDVELLTHVTPRPITLPSPLAGRVSRVARGLRHYHPGSAWLHGEGPTVLHAHGLHLLTARSVAAATRFGVPSVVKIPTSADLAMFSDPHGWQLAVDEPKAEALGRLRGFVFRRALRPLLGASAIIALNPAIRAELLALGVEERRIETIPNGVDVEHFQPPAAPRRAAARTALEIGDEEWVVGYVGRLAARKDVACLVDAFARLGTSNARLLIAGDGPERAELAARAKASGSGAHIALLGERADVDTVLAACDVAVNPSRREGQPGAVLEAWATGLATILSDIPGHADLADIDRAALRFACGDTTALAAALSRLHDDRERAAALGAAARAAAEQHYAIVSIARRYAQLYRRLVDGGARD